MRLPLALALALAACSPPPIVGPDDGVDGGAEAGVDAGTEAGVDVGADVALEAEAGADVVGDDAGDAEQPDAAADSEPPPDAAPCPDADGDGHRASSCGGDDCDDANPGAYPGHGEQCNGVDENCDGHADDAADPELAALDFYCNASQPRDPSPYAPPSGRGWDRGPPVCWSAGRAGPVGTAYVSVADPQCQAAHGSSGMPVVYRRICWRVDGTYAECPLP